MSELVKCCNCQVSHATRAILTSNYEWFYYCNDEKCETEIKAKTKDKNVISTCTKAEGNFTRDEQENLKITCKYTQGCTNGAIDWVYKWFQLSHRVQKKTFCCTSCLKIHQENNE